MSVVYLPVYLIEDLFDVYKYSESVNAVVCLRSPAIIPVLLANIRFVDKDDDWCKISKFVSQEIRRDTGMQEINGVIVWKPMKKAEAETLNAVGVPLYYTTDSF